MPEQKTQAYTQYNTASKWEAFARGTFKFLQPMSPITLSEDTQMPTFTLAKNRYTSRVLLLFQGTFTLTHASATTWATVKHRYAPYNLIKNIKVDASGLATPFNISGIGLNLLNRCRPNSLPFNEATVTTTRNMTTLTDLVASSANTVTFSFVLEVPFQLNQRDYIGLINTQNQNLNVNFDITTGNAEDLFTATTGYTVGTPSWTVTPLVESYLPVANTLPNANPADELIDFDVLKIVTEQNQTISSSGENIIKVPTGLKYRRMALNFYGSAESTALTDAQITRFTISVNQADSPIILTSTQLKMLNHMQLGGANAPAAGVYYFDLTDQGFINYGGSRDYIETYGINEFWIRFEVASGVTGGVKQYYESLQKLG